MGKLKLLRIFLFCLFTAMALGLKYYLANAPLEQLKFLLYPLSLAVKLCFGTHSYFDAEHGYVFPALTMYINRTCSGLNFLTLLWCCASTYILFKTPALVWKKNLVLSALLIYPVATVVNILRILALIGVQPLYHRMSEHSQAMIHEGIGALCFFGCLLMLFALAEKYRTRFIISNH